jgi:hypothetical protein
MHRRSIGGDRVLLSREGSRPVMEAGPIILILTAGAVRGSAAVLCALPS